MDLTCLDIGVGKGGGGGGGGIASPLFEQNIANYTLQSILCNCHLKY